MADHPVPLSSCSKPLSKYDEPLASEAIDKAIDEWFPCIDLIRDTSDTDLLPMERAIADAARLISALMVERAELRLALTEARGR